MDRCHVSGGALAVCAGLIALSAGCEKIEPSRPFEVEATPIAVLEIPNADVTGTVTDQAGGPLQDVRIDVMVGQQTRTVHSGADGSYRIPDLPAGAYDIAASKQGYVPGRVRVTQMGEEVSDADLVLHTHAASPGYHEESVAVGTSGEISQTTQVQSVAAEGVPTVEVELDAGTVLRDATGETATTPVTIRVTPIPAGLLGPPQVGTFGVTAADIQYLAGQPVPASIDVDLGEARVAYGVPILDPNPLLRQGAEARHVFSAAAFILEPEGMTLEDPEGGALPQPVVFGDLPLVPVLPIGSQLRLVDREGNQVVATVRPDGQSVEANIAKLTRYDLLVRLDLEVVERSILSAGVLAGTQKLTQGSRYEHEDGTTIVFPDLDWDQELINILGDLIREILGAYSASHAQIGEAVAVLSEGRLELREVSLGDTPVLQDAAATLGNRFPIRFVLHSQGEGG